MIPIREAFYSQEPVVSCSDVELYSDLVTEWKPRNMEVSIFRPLDPLLERSALDVVLRPVPTVLTLNNVELTLDPQGCGRVARVGTSSVHNDLVESVKAIDSKEVSRLY